MTSLPDWTENAVLVYGPRKAGTTLLLHLLDGVADFVVKPTETKLKFIAQGAPGDHLLVEHLPSDGLDRDAIAPWPLATLRENIFAIFEALADKPAKPKGWIMKDVGGDTVQVIGLFKRMFPDGRVIMITRDARMVARSVFNDRRRRGVKLSTRGIWRQAVDPIRVAGMQTEICNDGAPIHIVSYERLVNGHLREEMRALSNFLGVPYSEKLERPTVFGRPVVVGTASQNRLDVFPNKHHWTEGLSAREKICVRLAHLIS